MNIRMAQSLIRRNQERLLAHRRGELEFDLTPDEIELLETQIEWARDFLMESEWDVIDMINERRGLK